MRDLTPLIIEVLRDRWREYHAAQEIYYSSSRFRGGETSAGLARQLGIRAFSFERLRLHLTLEALARDGILERFVAYDSMANTGTVWRLCESIRRVTVPIGTERPYRRLKSFRLNKKENAEIDYR